MEEKKKKKQAGQPGENPPVDVEVTEQDNGGVDAEAAQALIKLKEAEDKYLRLLAEYDNFRKRSVRERETVYGDAIAEAVTCFLPVADNLARAVLFDGEGLKQGLELVMKQLDETLGRMGVSEIPALGEKFDPNTHDAVLHVENESLGESVISEVHKAGYRIGNKIIRHSIVTVAN